MINPTTISKIYSTLGNNNSLVPLAIKDVANSLGMSTGSYITGDKHEGKDRFMDEFGTMAIWLLGVPFYKKVLDFLLFKPFKLDPKIDVRNFKNQDILKQSAKFAPTEQIRNSIQKAMTKQKLMKGLTFGKFVASTVLTIISYREYTKYRHKVTENSIRKELLEQKEKQKIQDAQKNENPNFTGGLQDFMFSPVKNLMIVDAAITTERFTQSRNKQDLIGYIIKEGAFWGFVYFAGQKIQDHLESVAEKKYNRSIDLDARVIESAELKNAIQDGTLQKDIEKFQKVMDKSDAEIYEFINNNDDNFVVKMAKKSDIIPTYKDTNKIDTRKFVDIQKIKGVNTKLEKVLNQYESARLSSTKSEIKTLEIFLKQLRKLKRASVLKNIGACVGALGVAVPAIMVAIRFAGGQKQEFQTKKEIEKQLELENNEGA